jgi:hypothetical protein
MIARRAFLLSVGSLMAAGCSVLTGTMFEGDDSCQNEDSGTCSGRTYYAICANDHPSTSHTEWRGKPHCSGNDQQNKDAARADADCHRAKFPTHTPTVYP